MSTFSSSHLKELKVNICIDVIIGVYIYRCYGR